MASLTASRKALTLSSDAGNTSIKFSIYSWFKEKKKKAAAAYFANMTHQRYEPTSISKPEAKMSVFIKVRKEPDRTEQL